MPEEQVPTYDAAPIRGEMAASQITVEQLSKIADVSTPIISKIRHGKDVSVTSLARVCCALGLKIKIEKDAA